MKKILQALDGASTKPVEGSNDMKKFLSVVKEADAGQPPTGVNYEVNYLQKIVNGEGGRALLSPETAQAAPTQTLSQHYQSNPNVREGKTGNGLIKHYFESVQSEAQQAFDQRRAKIKEQARRIAQRMREDAKVTAIDPAKKTITYTDDQTGISTIVPQAMAKPGEGGQVMIDKNQVNQAVGQEQQPPAIKVGDMIKMMDTEAMSPGVRMQRALQREKEKREFSQRYAEKHFPIGKPKEEPKKDQATAESWSEKYKRSINCSHPKGFSQKAHCAGKKKHNESIEMERVCPDCGMCETHGNNMMEIKQRLDAKCWKGKHKEGTKIKGGVRVNNCVPNESVAEGNEDTSWMNKLRYKK